MKKKIILLFFITITSFSQTFNSQREWATYFGDDSIRITDSDVDIDGNIFLVGFVNRLDFSSNDSNFTTTASSYQSVFGGGVSDGIIVKINSVGNIVWSTYFGGENADSITSLRIDKNNDLCIMGQTSSTQNIATSGAFQTSTIGTSSFLAKFSNDGFLRWCTYYDNYLGINNDIPYDYLNYNNAYLDIDTSNNIYFSIRTSNEGMATTGSYQPIKNQPTGANLISKFTPTGQRVWATYYGINGSLIYGLCTGSDGFYLTGLTLDCAPTYSSNTFFATSGCHQQSPGSCRDIFLSKFSLEGNRIWSTYYGNYGSERINDNSVVAFGDSVYITGQSLNGVSSQITTPNCFQETCPLPEPTAFLIKFNNLGVRQWGTFYGYQGGSSVYSRVAKDNYGNVFLTGVTGFTQNISSIGSYQEIKNNLNDDFMAKFSPNGVRQWGTYYGGNGTERENVKCLINSDYFHIIGSTNSTDGISTQNSLQQNYATNITQSTNPSNFFIAKFSPTLATQQNSLETFSIYPNPNNGVFSISLPNSEKAKLEVYDVLGKLIHQQTIIDKEQIELKDVSKGIYFAKVMLGEKISKVQKIVVE